MNTLNQDGVGLTGTRPPAAQELMLTLRQLPSCPAARMDAIAAIPAHFFDAFSEELQSILTLVLQHDPDPIVRHEAAFVIGELAKQERIDSECAAIALRHAALDDPSVVARHEAAESLSSFYHPTAVKTLTELLDDPLLDIAATARIGLARLGHLKQAE
jgi:HEAT repeat protein